jgi:serine/threonine protein kinase/tetratricopeptide (TPR) repeat protein
MGPKHFDSFEGTERFQIRRRLGAGGMGVVYDAFDKERGQHVALKTILRLDGNALYRFKREFRALADVIHPNLVRLHELISEGDLWFFTMEMVDGTDFLNYVTRLEDDTAQANSESETIDHDPSAPAQPHRERRTNDTSLPKTETDPDQTAARTAVFDGADGDPETEVATTGDPNRQHEPKDPTQGDPAGSGLTFSDPDFSTFYVPRSPTSQPPEPLSWGVSALASVFGAADLPTRRLDVPRLRSAMRQLAEALAALHESGKLHRDIKPSNVLVTHAGRVVLLDFGLSIAFSEREGQSTSEGHVVGTVTYMSPEQAAAQSLSPASDWYSVGAMLYRALTGRLPFEGSQLDILMAKQRDEPLPADKLVEGLPEDLVHLCTRLVRRRPEDRPSCAEILEVLGSTASSLAGQALGGPASRPFVGRESQMKAIGSALAQVREGRTVAAFVSGRSGAGKSALIQRFLDGVIERDEAVVLAGRCYEQESVAYKALDTLIDALSRYLHRLSSADANALLPRDVPALARVFPVLRRVEAVANAPRRSHEIPDQQELRRRAFGALRELLTRIGDRKTLILSIDDLQWGDADSASLLVDLLRPPDPPVLLLIGSYRSEYEHESPCLRMVLEREEGAPQGFDRIDIAVKSFSFSEAARLAQTLLEQDDEAARMVAEMVARESAGSPYFIYELVAFLKGGGQLSETMINSGEFSLDEVLWRRVLMLPDTARALLVVLAVAGHPLRQATACQAAGAGADGFASLSFLRTNHLVRGTGAGSFDRVETYHDRIRETIVRRIDAAQTPAIHRALALALEEPGDADPETLAIHFEAGELPDRAAGYYGDAACVAAETLAFARAAKLYRKALERPSDPTTEQQLRVRLADALANAGHGVEAAECYLQAARGAHGTEQLELERHAAYQYLISGHIDEGLAAISAILDRVGMPLPSTPQRALARLLWSRLMLRMRGLRFRERAANAVPTEQLELVDISRSVAVGFSVVDTIRGADYQTRSLLLALRAGEPMRIALSLGWEAVHSSCGGLPARRRTAKLNQLAQSLAEKIGHPHALGMASLSFGASSYLEGKFRAGLEHLDRSTEIFRGSCTGVMWELDTSHIFGLWALFYLGELKELARRCDALFDEANERGDRYLVATPGPYVGAIARIAVDDDVQAAREFARDAMSQWSQQGFHIQHLCHFYGNSYADLYAGDSGTSWRRVQDTWPILKNSLLLRIQHVVADVMHISGRSAIAAAAAAKDPAALVKRADDYARKLDRLRIPWARAMAALIRAGGENVLGRPDRAIAGLTRAVELLETANCAHFAAAACRHLGRLQGGDEGRRHIEAADAWMKNQAIKNVERMADCLAPGFAKLR